MSKPLKVTKKNVVKYKKDRELANAESVKKSYIDHFLNSIYEAMQFLEKELVFKDSFIYTNSDEVHEDKSIGWFIKYPYIKDELVKRGFEPVLTEFEDSRIVTKVIPHKWLPWTSSLKEEVVIKKFRKLTISLE